MNRDAIHNDEDYDSKMQDQIEREEVKELTCQQCGGTGKIFLRPNHKKIPFIDCDMCQGTGKHDRNLLWEIQGSLFCEWRDKNDLTLREAARKYKIDPSNLSKMERGIIKPSSYLIRLATGNPQ